MKREGRSWILTGLLCLWILGGGGPATGQDGEGMFRPPESGRNEGRADLPDLPSMGPRLAPGAGKFPGPGSAVGKTQLPSLPQFTGIIPKIQPLLLYDANRYGGIFRFFDDEETVPSLSLFYDGDKVVENNVTRFYSLFTSGSLWGTLAGAEGAAYYHSLRVTWEGLPYLIHQFWYYFPVGDGPEGAYHNGFCLVELYQRIDPTAGELAAYRQELLAEYEGYRKKLLANVGRGPQEEKLLRSLGELIARGETLPLPIHTHIRKVATAGPMAMGGVRPTLRWKAYERNEVEWTGTRLKVWVTQMHHRFVCSRKDLEGEECDPPYKTYPGGREILINLHDPYAKANPVPGGVNRWSIDFKGQFVAHPFFRTGILIQQSRAKTP